MHSSLILKLDKRETSTTSPTRPTIPADHIQTAKPTPLEPENGTGDFKAQRGLYLFLQSNPVHLASFLGLECCSRLAFCNLSLARVYNPARCINVREAAASCLTALASHQQFGFWCWALGVRVCQKKFFQDPLHSQWQSRANKMVAFANCNGDQESDHQEYACLEKLLTTGVQGEILRDIPRTYPTHPLFKTPQGPGQQMLANVLFALVYYHEKVGYCQGMNFVAGGLLISHFEGSTAAGHPRRWTHFSSGTTPSDDSKEYAMAASLPANTSSWLTDARYMDAMEDVFWVMTAILFNKLQMTKLWTKGVPLMKLRVFQFVTLMKAEVPKVITHLHRIQLQPDILVTQWFLTLYSYTLPLEVVLCLWNSIFLDGWKAMFRIGLARLKLMEQHILALDLEEMSIYLRKLKTPSTGPDDHRAASADEGGLHSHSSAVSLLKISQKIRLTNAELKGLEQEFEVQLLKERIALGDGKAGEWLLRYGEQEEDQIDPFFLQEVKDEIGNVTNPLRGDALILQQKIVVVTQRVAALKEHAKQLIQQMAPLQLDLEDLLERKKLLRHQIRDLVEAFQIKSEQAKQKKVKPKTRFKAVFFKEILQSSRPGPKRSSQMEAHGVNPNGYSPGSTTGKTLRNVRSLSAAAALVPLPSKAPQKTPQPHLKNVHPQPAPEMYSRVRNTSIDASDVEMVEGEVEDQKKIVSPQIISRTPTGVHRKGSSLGALLSGAFNYLNGSVIPMTKPSSVQKDSAPSTPAPGSLFKATTIQLELEDSPGTERSNNAFAAGVDLGDLGYNSDEEENNFITSPQNSRPSMYKNLEESAYKLSHQQKQVSPLLRVMDGFQRLYMDKAMASELKSLRSDMNILRARVHKIDVQYARSKDIFIKLLKVYEPLKVEIEEGIETKMAISNQLLTLIQESDMQIDTKLRKFADLFTAGKDNCGENSSQSGYDPDFPDNDSSSSSSTGTEVEPPLFYTPHKNQSEQKNFSFQV